MAARLLWDKGVREYINAAQILAERGVPVDFLLAGEPDVAAPGYVPTEKLNRWDESGIIRWLGHRSDMPALLREVDVAVLPTHYNEGLPRFLVESASSGLPLIASDLPACHRVVEDGVNGYIVPRKNPRRLAKAIEHLARNSKVRQRMGRASREKAISKFDQNKIVDQWLNLYRSMIVNGGGRVE
jgi:glycosyltransferase involved in cell wall biosynthesis